MSPSPPLEGKGQPTAAGPAGDPSPEDSPTFRQLRDLLDRGEYAATVRLAYRSAFEGTVRAFGLTVPPAYSDRQFLKEFLRPDMGRLTELLPELYRRYEPARFGKVEDGDRNSLRALLEKLYSQTALARIHDPHFQPSGPQPEGDRTSAYDTLFRSLRKEKT